MAWYATVVLYIGMFDAAVIMIGGLITSGVILAGVDASLMWDRIWPATGALIGSNVAAALILGATRWLLGT